MRWRRVASRAKVDAAFIGNTTFGGGLPAGDVTRPAFDSCARFDGPSSRRRSVARDCEPCWPRRTRMPIHRSPARGEFNIADGPPTIDDAKTYRIATTDWGARNTSRYFGEPAMSGKNTGTDAQGHCPADTRPADLTLERFQALE